MAAALLRPAERHRSVEGGQHPRAGREDQRVVADRVPAAQHDPPGGRVDRRDARLHERRAEVVDDAPQRVPPRLAEAERLGDGHRPDRRNPARPRRASRSRRPRPGRASAISVSSAATPPPTITTSAPRTGLGHGPKLRLRRATVNGCSRRVAGVGSWAWPTCRRRSARFCGSVWPTRPGPSAASRRRSASRARCSGRSISCASRRRTRCATSRSSPRTRRTSSASRPR